MDGVVDADDLCWERTWLLQGAENKAVGWERGQWGAGVRMSRPAEPDHSRICFPRTPVD